MKKILITNKPDLKSLFVNGLLLTFKPDHYIDLQQTAFYIYDIFHKENGDYTFSKANVRHFEIGAQIFVIDGVKILALHKEQNRRFPLSQAIRLGKKHDCAVIFARTKERVFRYQDQILIIGLDSFESNQLLGLSFSVLIAVEAGLFCYASLIRHKEVSVYTGQVKNELIQRVYAPTTRLQSKYQLDNKFEDFYIEKIAKQQATQLTTGAAELLEIHNLQRHIRPNTLMKTIVPHSQEEEQLKNPVSLSHLDHLVSRKSDLPVKEKPVDYYLHPYGPKRTYLIDQLLEQHWDTAYQKKITDDKSEDMAVLESEEDADYGEVAPQTTSSSGDQSYLSSTPEPVELTFPPEATAKKEVEETKSAPFSDQLSEVSPVTVDYLGYDFGAGGEVFEETSVEEKPAVVFDEKELPSQPSDPNPPLPEEPTEQGRKLAVPMDDHVDDDYSHYAGKPISDDQGFELEELITTSDDHKLASQEEELLIPSEEVKTTPDQQLEPSSLPADLLASSADAEQFVTPEINQDDEGWVPYEQYTEEGVSTEPALVERDDSQEDIFDKLISEWNQGLAEQQKEEHLEPEPLTAVTESGRNVTFGDDQQLEDQSQATTLEPSLVEDQSFTSKPSSEQQEEKVEQEFTYDNNQPTRKPAEAGKKSRFFGRFLGGLFARKKQSPQPPKELLEQEFSAVDDGDEQDTETSTKQQATKTNLEESLTDLTKEPQLTKHSADHDPFLSDDFWEESVGKTELSSQEAFQPLQQEVSPSEPTFDQLLQVQEVGSSLENEPGLAMEREEQLVSGKLEEESLVGQQLTGIDTEEQKEIPKKMFTEETSPILEELMPDEMGPTDEVVPQIFEQQKISSDLDLDSDLSKLKPLEDYLYQKSPFSVDDSQQPAIEEQETEEKLTSPPLFLKEDEGVTEESEKSLEDFSFQPPFPYKSLADDQQLTGIDGQQQPETPETVLTQPIATAQKKLVSEEMGPTDEVVPQIFGQQKISLDLELDSDLSKLKPLATNLSSAKPFSVTTSEQLTTKELGTKPLSTQQELIVKDLEITEGARTEQLVSGKLEEESLVGQQLTGIDTEEQKEIPKKMFTEETSPILEELMPDEMGPTDEVVPQIFEQQKISSDLDLDGDLSKLKPLEDYLYQKSPFSVDDSQQLTTEELTTKQPETTEKSVMTTEFLPVENNWSEEDEITVPVNEQPFEDFSSSTAFSYKNLADDQQLTGIDGQQQPETPETVLTQPIATAQKKLVSEEMGPTDEVVPQIFGQQKISLDLELDSDLSKLKPLATNLSSAKPFSVTTSEQLTAKTPSLKEDESLAEEKEQLLEDFLSPIHFPYKNLTDQQLTEIGDEQETEDYSSLLIDQTDPSFKETEPTKDKYLSDLPKDHKTQTFADDLDVHDFTNFHQRQFDDPEDGQLLTDFQSQPVSQQPEEQVLDPVATGVSGHDHQQDYEPKQPFTKDLSTFDQQSSIPFLEDQDQQVDLTTSKIAALTAKSWVKRKQIIKELLVNFEDALLVINEFNQIVDLGVDYIQDASIWTQVQKEQVHTWKHKVEDHLFQKSIEEQYQNGRFLISNHKVRLVNQQLVYFVFKFMKRAIRLLNILIDHEHSLNKGKKALKIHHKSMRRLEHLFKGYQKKYQLE